MEFDVHEFATRLRLLMDEKNDTVYSLGDSVYLSPGTISKLLNEKLDNPRRRTIESIAIHYQVNPVWLMGLDVERNIDLDRFVKVAILNDARNKRDIEGYEYVRESLHIDFCFHVKDDSMVNARILTNDLIYVRRQSDVESGEIAVVAIDGEVLLKRIYKTNGLFVLKSDNLSNQDERVFTKKEIRAIEILGKVIMFRSMAR
ncbi:MAG: hypothetical protein APF81_27475 [Desulfosporosinus sp. BRH_c37]|nr:MAG: hypothetical protein APF81_27475 [Desulfosporosinus sp. BRH_c37]